VPRPFLDHRENQEPQLAIVERSSAAPAVPAATAEAFVFTVGGILVRMGGVVVVLFPVMAPMRLFGV
jgi:hypothetical protein